MSRRNFDRIKEDNIKALFIDEYDLQENDHFIKEALPLLEIIWIVPSTAALYFNRKGNISHLNDFVHIDLSQNMRNSKEIVKFAQSIAEEKNYAYAYGLVMPPENFPSGCTPIHVDSLENALTLARKLTKEGILVIGNEYELSRTSNLSISNKENLKMYTSRYNDFKEYGNPYSFLKDGNILFVDDFLVLGFEWPTVVVFKNNTNNVTYHECNYLMRCTTNLLIVGMNEDDENDSENDENDSENGLFQKKTVQPLLRRSISF